MVIATLNAKLAALLGVSLMLAGANPAAAFVQASGVGVAAVRQRHRQPCSLVASTLLVLMSTESNAAPSARISREFGLANEVSAARAAYVAAKERAEILSKETGA